MICDRCGDDMPAWDTHTAGDGNDVCSGCCDVCEEETMTMTTMEPGIIGSNVHFAAAGIGEAHHGRHPVREGRPRVHRVRHTGGAVVKLADIEARRRYQAERQAHRDRLRRRAVFAVFEWMAGWTR